MAECKTDQNQIICNYSYPCGKKGMCCDCLRTHLSNGEFPACFFPDDVERTYDRSIDNFIKIYKEKGFRK